MKVIIAGSRSIEMSPSEIDAIVSSSGFMVSEVVCGEAKGADRSGSGWAMENHIPVSSFPAMWDTHGKRAGMIRNQQMALHADALIALWDGKSKGTLNMISTMKKLGKPVFTWRSDQK